MTFNVIAIGLQTKSFILKLIMKSNVVLRSCAAFSCLRIGLKISYYYPLFHENTGGILILSILVGAHPTEFEANLCSSLEEVEKVKMFMMISMMDTGWLPESHSVINKIKGD